MTGQARAGPSLDRWPVAVMGAVVVQLRFDSVLGGLALPGRACNDMI